MLRIGVAGVLVCAAFLPSTSSAEAREPILLRVPAAIDVLADGSVSEVALEGVLPLPVAQAIKEAAMQWRFEPVQLQGNPASGRTYSRLAVCVAQSDGQLLISTVLQDNGPAQVKQTAPIYPADALRHGQSGEFDVTFVVGEDGVATLEKIDATKGRPGPFKRAIEDWIKTSQFRPEQLNGKPVATRLRWPVGFHTGEAERDRSRKYLATQGSLHPACQAALGKQLTQEAVALDSPFKPVQLTAR